MTLAAATGLLALLLTPRADSAWILWTLGALWGLTFSSLYPGLMTLASRIARPGMDARALAFTLSLVMPWVGLGLVGWARWPKGTPSRPSTSSSPPKGSPSSWP